MSPSPLSLSHVLCGVGAGGEAAPVSWPHLCECKLYSSVQRTVSSCREATGTPYGKREEGVLSGSSGSELGVGLANEGSLGFYSTRISISTAIHDMRTDVTTEHDQQTGGGCERRLRKEGGPGWGVGQETWPYALQTHRCPGLNVRDSGGQLGGQGHKQLSQRVRVSGLGVYGGRGVSQLPPKPSWVSRQSGPHRLWVLFSLCDCFRRLCWIQGSGPLWHQHFLQPKDRKAPTGVPA